MTPYYLCARIRATDPKRLNETRHELAALQTITNTEPACREFRILEDEEFKGDFLLWECWDGKAGLDAHYAATHTRQYLDKKLTDVIEITELTELEVQH